MDSGGPLGRHGASGSLASSPKDSLCVLVMVTTKGSSSWSLLVCIRPRPPISDSGWGGVQGPESVSRYEVEATNPGPLDQGMRSGCVGQVSQNKPGQAKAAAGESASIFFFKCMLGTFKKTGKVSGQPRFWVHERSYSSHFSV